MKRRASSNDRICQTRQHRALGTNETTHFRNRLVIVRPAAAEPLSELFDARNEMRVLNVFEDLFVLRKKVSVGFESGCVIDGHWFEAKRASFFGPSIVVL